jgi:CheY-like chemotaxis protein
VKIAAVTASAYASERATALDSGMDDFVRKPYRIHEIFDTMLLHLGVKYRHEGTIRTTYPEPTPVVLSAALAELPESLRTELANAVVSLDVEWIRAIITRVSERDALLASALRSNEERGSLSEIYHAIKQCNLSNGGRRQ